MTTELLETFLLTQGARRVTILCGHCGRNYGLTGDKDADDWDNLFLAPADMFVVILIQ